MKTIDMTAGSLLMVFFTTLFLAAKYHWYTPFICFASLIFIGGIALALKDFYKAMADRAYDKEIERKVLDKLRADMKKTGVTMDERYIVSDDGKMYNVVIYDNVEFVTEVN